MRRKSSSAVPAVALFFLIAISSLSPFIFSQQDDTAGPLEFENIIPARSGASGDPGVSDVPVWRIGDKWIYSGTFDPTALIVNSGVSASVGEINGDTTAEVISITEHFNSSHNNISINHCWGHQQLITRDILTYL